MKNTERFKIPLSFAVLLIVPFWLLYAAITIIQSPREEECYDYGALNDTLIKSSGTIYDNGAVMVQLDWFCEIIGAELTQDKRQFTINWQDKELVIKLYSKKASLNGETFYQYNAPAYKDGKVFIHIRTIWEKLKLRTGHYGLCEFGYDGDITSQNHFHVYTWDYLNTRKTTATN